jgi:hypothetical protein
MSKFPAQPQGFISIIVALLLGSLLTLSAFTTSDQMIRVRTLQSQTNDRHYALVAAESCLFDILARYQNSPATLYRGISIQHPLEPSCVLVEMPRSTASSDGVRLLFTVSTIWHTQSVFLEGAASPCGSDDSLCIASWNERTSIPP